MKKVITILLLAILGAGAAAAQIVRSESRSYTVIKEDKIIRPHNWFVKAGVGVMGSNGAAYGKSNVAAGYQKQFSANGLYWGAQLGLTFIVYDGSNEYRPDGIEDSAPAIFAGSMIGIKRSLGTNTCFDPHIGVGYARAFASDDDGDDCHRVIWEIGLGLWYKRFLVELEYQGSYGFLVDNGVLLNIGFKF